MLIGYARVSRGDDQSNKAQSKALTDAGCQRIFKEEASGGRWERPELHRMLDQLRDVDTIVVWKLDRLSRSLKDVLNIMERIKAAGAGFRSLGLRLPGVYYSTNDDEANRSTLLMEDLSLLPGASVVDQTKGMTATEARQVSE